RQLLSDLAEYLRDSGMRTRELPVGGEPFAGWELLAAAVCPPNSSILDFFEMPLIVIDEPEMTKAAAERFWGRLRDSPGSAYIKPEAGAMEWDEFQEL